MKKRKLLLILAFVVMAPGFSFGASTWSADPAPTGTCVASPDKVTLEDTVTFEVRNLEDLDTLTTMTPTSNCVSVTRTTDPDPNKGGSWQIIQPGVPGITTKNGLTADVEAKAWDWSTSGEGDTGAVKTVSGLFTFSDGRLAGDLRHDTTGLGIGGASSILLIPDAMTTALANCFGSYPNHWGSSFRMTVSNTFHPTYFFGGMTVQEKILYIDCQVHNQEVDAIIQSLISSANSTWTIDGANSFIDKHITGPSMERLFVLGNTAVMLWQVFKITSGGWDTKNPNHRIGKEGGLSGLFSGIHMVVYTLETPNPPPAFWRVTKDGVTCSDTP